MAPAPNVSVVIPTQNCLQWLPAAIDSIGADPDVEIIVVDDGSTDGTDDWLVERAREDRRLRIVKGLGRGPALARNTGLDHVRAKLVAFLDADDTWRAGKLAAQYALHARAPEIGFSFTDYRHVTVDDEDRGPCFAFWPHFHARHGHRKEAFVLGEAGLADLYAENVVGTSTVMVRTDLLRQVGGFATGLSSAEDWELWLRLAGEAPVGCVPMVLADYLMHRPGNVTGRHELRVLAMRVIAARYRAKATRLDPRSVAICEARLLAARAELHDRRGQRLAALALRLAALRRHPTRRLARETAAAAVKQYAH